jgi:hypothetical protein
VMVKGGWSGNWMVCLFGVPCLYHLDHFRLKFAISFCVCGVGDARFDCGGILLSIDGGPCGDFVAIVFMCRVRDVILCNVICAVCEWRSVRTFLFLWRRRRPF